MEDTIHTGRSSHAGSLITDYPEWLATVRRPNIGVISNPLSGGNRKGLQPVERILSGYRRVWHRKAVDLEQVTAAVRDFACRGVDLLVVNGGDGTIHAVLTALFTAKWPHRLPVLALLRAGTASMIARDVGLRGSRLQALSRLLEWASSGRGAPSIVERPVLRLEGALGAQPIYGMFFGAGGIYQGIEFCLNRIHRAGVRGELAAGLTLGRFLLAALGDDKRTIPPAAVQMSLDGMEMQPINALVILATTLKRLFLGMRPYWGSESGPLHFTAVRSDAEHFLWAFPSLIRGRRGRLGSPDHGYISHNVREIRLLMQSGFTLDGQLYLPDPQLGGLSLRSGGRIKFFNI
jgi:hypothetical protein